MARPVRESSIVTDADLPAANPVVLAEIGHAQTQISQNTLALADQLGYDGSLTVGALEDEIRFYQRRSVEAILALGTRLALLKEMSPHGEFVRRIELLGFSVRTAQRFMQAALKTAKSATVAHLADQISNSGKFLELVTLDDDDLAALKDGGTLAGLTLDDVEKMSVSELRAALREARENEQAVGRILREKNEKLDKLATENNKKTPVVDLWNAQLLSATDELSSLGTVGDEVLGKHVAFIDLCETLADKLDPEAAGYRDQLEQVRVPIARLGSQIERFAHIVARLRFEFDTRVGGHLDNSHILTAEDAE